jgi:probable F420-dependent oxidoreductase
MIGGREDGQLFRTTALGRWSDGGLMKVGIQVYNMPVAELVELAQAADELGFDALWLGEHLVHPVDYASVHPAAEGAEERLHRGKTISDETILEDTWVTLGAVAKATERIGLATAVYLLPLRHPLATARAAMTVHDLSGARLTLGVGAGWLREEFDALAVPFDRRWSLLEEDVHILRSAWEGGTISHSGKNWNFDSVKVTSTKVNIPLVFGGNTDRALQRAARLGDGWFVSGGPVPEEMLRLRRQLLALRAADGREGPFRCHLRLLEPDPAQLDRFAADGVEDIVIWGRSVWPKGPLSKKKEVLAQAAIDYRIG